MGQLGKRHAINPLNLADCHYGGTRPLFYVQRYHKRSALPATSRKGFLPGAMITFLAAMHKRSPIPASSEPRYDRMLRSRANKLPAPPLGGEPRQCELACA